MIENVALIYFSPTGTTRQVLEGITHGLKPEHVHHLDITPSGSSAHEFDAPTTSLALIGAPVYGGRLPLEAVERLRGIQGAGLPAILVAVYGNRAYEDALAELKGLAVGSGFQLLAAGAFIGEHSYSTASAPIAPGRPDRHDLEAAANLGRAAAGKLYALKPGQDLPDLEVPGDAPMREHSGSFHLSLGTVESLCDLGGECAAVCPTAAITITDRVITDGQACIYCCACVKVCPTGARLVDDERFPKLIAWLLGKCDERREPEVFV